MSAILSVRDLEKTFGSIVAARDITLDVPAEQTVGIIGANGAGKTTFINMITGHLRPSKGTIRFEERDITGRPSREITRLGMSRSFQVAQIFPSLTVFENMCAAAAVARGRGGTLAHALAPLRSPERIAQAEAALDAVPHRAATATCAPRRCRRACASCSTSPWRWSARPACCCSTSRPAASRSRRSSASWKS